MQQALEALEWNYNTDLDNIPACEQWAKMLNETITALKQALAEPEQEPVAWLWQHSETGRSRVVTSDQIVTADATWFVVGPLYLGSAPTPRKPLSDEEIDRVTDQQWAQNNHKPIYAAHRAYARAIERKHGIGEQHE